MLLPNKFRIIGFVLLVIGLGFAISRFYYGIKPGYLDWYFFAIHSSYIDGKHFQFIANNFGEELPGIFILIGLYFIGFSKEKVETEKLNQLRLKSFLLTFLINTLFLFFSFFFFFGFGFLNILILNLFTPLIIYIFILRLLLFKHRRLLNE